MAPTAFSSENYHWSGKTQFSQRKIIRWKLFKDGSARIRLEIGAIPLHRKVNCSVCEQEVGDHQVIVSFFVAGSFKGSGVVHLCCQFIRVSRAVQLREHHKNVFPFISSNSVPPV